MVTCVRRTENNLLVLILKNYFFSGVMSKVVCRHKIMSVTCVKVPMEARGIGPLETGVLGCYELTATGCSY